MGTLSDEAHKDTRICVLLATYNGGAHLEDQLNSILNQLGGFQISILCSDDGSTDSTLKILSKYNIDVLPGPKTGAAANFSYLIENSSKYDFYALSDQDDVWFPDKLLSSVEKIKSINGPALYVGTSEIDKCRLLKPRQANLYAALISNRSQGCTFLINNELMDVLKSTIKFRTLMHDWFIYLIALLFGQVIYDFESKMFYRLHASNDTGIPKLHTKLGRLALDLILPGRGRAETLQAQKLLEIPGLRDEDRESISMWTVGVQASLIHRINFVVFKFRPNVPNLYKFAYGLKIICKTYTVNGKT